MSTAFQALLDRAEGFLETADPEPIRLAVLPDVDLAANVGDFRLSRVMRSTGFVIGETGPIVVRRSVLAAAGITADPKSGDKLTARGKTYRIETVWPSTTNFRLDCINVA